MRERNKRERRGDRENLTVNGIERVIQKNREYHTSRDTEG